MRRAIAVVVLLVVMLAGCSAPPVVAHISPTPSPTNPMTKEIYLKLMHELPAFASSSDAALVDLAKSTCAVIVGDNGWFISVKSFTDHGIDPTQTGEAIQYGVSAYCPEEQVNIPG